MSNSAYFVIVYITFMLMTVTQFIYLVSDNNSYITNTPKTIQRRRRIQYEPPIPYNHLNRFIFVGLNDVLYYHLMRFTPRELLRILPLLSLYEIRFCNCLQATCKEALTVVLIRLSYSTCYWAMMDQFGHGRIWLSIVFNDIIIHIYWRYRKKLVWDDRRLTFAQLTIYSQVIHNLGGASCFWGFIDGTLNATYRLIILDQQEFYSGHKRKHRYKYQVVVTSDGLVSSLIGPFIGRRGDWAMVEQSGLAEKLRTVNGDR